MAVSDLNGVSKKGPNWTKLTKIKTYLNTTKVKTYLKKFDENWDQKGILTKRIYIVETTLVVTHHMSQQAFSNLLKSFDDSTEH